MKVMVVAMVALYGVGMGIWLVLYTCYSKALWDVRNKYYKRAMIRNTIKRYVDCKNLDISVGDIKAFVDKSITGYEIGGLSLYVLERLGRLLEMLLIGSGIALFIGCVAWYKGAYVFLLLGITEFVALVICRRLAGIKDMRGAITASLTRYLKSTALIDCMIQDCEAGEVRLTIKAYMDFQKLNRCFNRIYERRKVCGNTIK